MDHFCNILQQADETFHLTAYLHVCGRVVNSYFVNVVGCYSQTLRLHWYPSNWIHWSVFHMKDMLGGCLLEKAKPCEGKRRHGTRG